MPKKDTRVSVRRTLPLRHRNRPLLPPILLLQPGNWHHVEFRHDNKKYGDEPYYRYAYDASANLGYHQDLVNDVSYRYLYDVSDRLMKISDSRGNSTAYEYDLDNNISAFKEQINSQSYATSYEYDKDNRPTVLTSDATTGDKGTGSLSLQFLYGKILPR